MTLKGEHQHGHGGGEGDLSKAWQRSRGLTGALWCNRHSAEPEQKHCWTVIRDPQTFLKTMNSDPLAKGITEVSSNWKVLFSNVHFKEII